MPVSATCARRRPPEGIPCNGPCKLWHYSTLKVCARKTALPLQQERPTLAIGVGKIGRSGSGEVAPGSWLWRARESDHSVHQSSPVGSRAQGAPSFRLPSVGEQRLLPSQRLFSDRQPPYPWPQHPCPHVLASASKQQCKKIIHLQHTAAAAHVRHRAQSCELGVPTHASLYLHTRFGVVPMPFTFEAFQRCPWGRASGIPAELSFAAK